MKRPRVTVRSEFEDRILRRFDRWTYQHTPVVIRKPKTSNDPFHLIGVFITAAMISSVAFSVLSKDPPNVATTTIASETPSSPIDTTVTSTTSAAREGYWIKSNNNWHYTGPPVGRAGEPYSWPLSIEPKDFVWRVAEGELPPGLTLRNNVIRGTPKRAGEWSATFTGSNAEASTTINYSFMIKPEIIK
jgi:hypothetical protein